MLRWDTGGGMIGIICCGILAAWAITELVRYIEGLFS